MNRFIAAIAAMLILVCAALAQVPKGGGGGGTALQQFASDPDAVACAPGQMAEFNNKVYVCGDDNTFTESAAPSASGASSVFGRTGDVVAVDGDYTQAKITGLKTTDNVTHATVTLNAASDGPAVTGRCYDNAQANPVFMIQKTSSGLLQKHYCDGTVEAIASAGPMASGAATGAFRWHWRVGKGLCWRFEGSAEECLADMSAATADALSTNPTACPAGEYVSDVDADGTLTCGTPAGGGGAGADNQILTIAEGASDSNIVAFDPALSDAGIISVAGCSDTAGNPYGPLEFMLKSTTQVQVTLDPDGVVVAPTGGIQCAVNTSGGGTASPLTTKGDLWVTDGTDQNRLPVGTDGQVLVADSASTNGVKWDTVAGGTGIVSMTTGASDPTANCTAPSSSVLNLFTQTTTQDIWACVATNTWKKILSTTNTGTYAETGATGTAPSRPSAGELTCYFDSTANTQICLDSGTGTYAVVKTEAARTANQFVTHFNANGVQQTAAIAHADLPAIDRTRSITFVISGTGTSNAMQDTDDVLTTVWQNALGGGITITGVSCETDSATATRIQLTRRDGSPANILTDNAGAGLDCTSTRASGAIDTNEDNIANGQGIGYLTVSAGANAHEVSVTFTFTID